MKRYRCIGAKANLMGKCEKGVLKRWPNGHHIGEAAEPARYRHLRLAIGIIGTRLILHVRRSYFSRRHDMSCPVVVSIGHTTQFSVYTGMCALISIFF